MKNPLNHQIKFNNNGANFVIFATNIANPYDDNPTLKKSQFKFFLDEVFVFPYLYFFLKPHFNFDIQNRVGEWYKDDETNEKIWEEPERIFDAWGNNYYTYDSIYIIIEDIKTTLKMMQNDFNNPILNNFKSLLRDLHIDYDFMEEFYPELHWNFKKLSIDEQNAFIEKHLPIIVNLYERIIAILEKMMNDNPHLNLICFAGP